MDELRVGPCFCRVVWSLSLSRVCRWPGLGWGLFGLAVGMAEGLAAGVGRKLLYGAIGGLLGGIIGGVGFAIMLLQLQPGEVSYLWGQALGLVILGAVIGAMTALVEEVCKPASLRIIQGWQEGREYPLVAEACVVGRAESADILLLRDPGVAHRHILIRRDGSGFRLELLEGASPRTRVNDLPVNGSVALHNGDRIQLGTTMLRFYWRGTQSTKQ